MRKLSLIVGGMLFAGAAHAASITSLFSFNDFNGYSPYANVIADSSGNLYGTTAFGGASGSGTVFKLAKSGVLTTAVTFSYGKDGGIPFSDLIADSSGNIFGTTSRGGTSGQGTVFELTKSGSLITLANFGGGDNANPRGGLYEDSSGNLFGTTAGQLSSDKGTVFEVVNGGGLKTLATFTGGADGSKPWFSSVIGDGAGNIYGTTSGGGGAGFGTIFEVDKSGVFKTLASFAGVNESANPEGGLYLDASGNLFGTTVAGGNNGEGTIYKLAKGGGLTTLAAFNGTNGANPHGELIGDAAGNLFGTTYAGGISNDGTVFEFTKSGVLTPLAYFKGGDGANPGGKLYADAAGDLYGTTAFGGKGGAGKGTVFKLGGSGFVVPSPGVPEPASWTMMIAGFGLAGSALRRRHISKVVSA